MNSERNSNIIDLGGFILGLGVCIFLMYLVGNIIYQTGDVWSYNSSGWIIIFLILTLITSFAIFVVTYKLKMLV